MAQQQQQHEAGGGHLGASPVYKLYFGTGMDSKSLQLTIQSEVTPRSSALYQYYSKTSEVHSVLMARRERKKIKTLNIYKPEDHYVDVLAICKTIKSCLPGLKKLIVRRTNMWADQELAMLFEHLPSTFLTLQLDFLERPNPLSFQHIPRSFPKLEELILQECRAKGHNAWPTASFEGLGNTLRQLPTLEKLTMENVVCGSATDWNPVLQAIYDHPNLVNLRFETLLEQRPGPGTVTDFRFGTEIEERILSALRIRRLMKEHDFVRAQTEMDEMDEDDSFYDGNCALRTWVNAMVDARHHMDCLDHLLCNFDPSIYANAAIKGLSGPYKRRAWWLENTDKGRAQRMSELDIENSEAEVEAGRCEDEHFEVFVYEQI